MTERSEHVQVLWVEDSPDDRTLITYCLKKLEAPLDVRFLEDGKQALRVLFGDSPPSPPFPPPQLLILDINLPFHNGFEILNMVRHSPELRRLKVVICTSSNYAPDIERARQLGADGYYLKPVGLARFSQTIGDIVALADTPSPTPRMGSNLLEAASDTLPG